MLASSCRGHVGVFRAILGYGLASALYLRATCNVRCAPARFSARGLSAGTAQNLEANVLSQRGLQRSSATGRGERERESESRSHFCSSRNPTPALLNGRNSALWQVWGEGSRSRPTAAGKAESKRLASMHVSWSSSEVRHQSIACGGLE